MNREYIPILGELRNNTCILNIISYTTSSLFIEAAVPDGNSIVKIELKRNTTTSTILNLNNTTFIFKLRTSDPTETYIIDHLKIIIPKSITNYFYVFNCDCHFLPETDSWKTVDTTVNTSETYLAFHVGDQIYMDEIFIKICNNLKEPCCTDKYSDDDIMNIIYQTYKTAFLRKKNVLQGCFNIMLGDDHDLCDESLRNKYDKEITKRVIRLLRKAYDDIQAKLRFDLHSSITYNDHHFVLLDNIEVNKGQQYIDKLLSAVKLINANDQSNIHIMSPRVVMNDDLSCCTRCAYSSTNDITDYTMFYNYLFNMSVKDIKIYCGDAHIAKKFILKREARMIELYCIGTMNSVIDDYDANEFLKVKDISVTREYMEKVHSYIVVNGNKVEHKYIDCRTNRWFGSMIYLWKVKC